MPNTRVFNANNGRDYNEIGLTDFLQGTGTSASYLSALGADNKLPKNNPFQTTQETATVKTTGLPSIGEIIATRKAVTQQFQENSSSDSNGWAASPRQLSNAPTSGFNLKKLNGSGVSVAIIDSPWSGTFNSHFTKKPTEINVELSTGLNNYQAPEDTFKHGERVTMIIADKNYGIAPGVTLYHGKLSTSRYHDYINSIHKYAPDTRIINLSLGRDPWYPGQQVDSLYVSSSVNQADERRYKEEKDKIVERLRWTMAGLRDTSNFEPLVVQSTGNQHKLQDYIATYTSGRTNVYYGQKLEDFHDEAAIVLDPRAGKTWIQVTGFNYDPTDEYRYKVELYKEYLAHHNKLTSDKRVELDQQAKQIKKSSPDFYSDIPKDHYYPDILMIQCGAAKWSCLAASFYNSQVSINSAGREEQNRYFEFAGTSASAPQVSGIAALVAQNFPWMRGSELKTTLLTTATDIGPAGVDEVFGWGAVNAAKALRGPAQFFFEDFNANLSRYVAGGSYTFSNSIDGAYGLNLTGNNHDWLFLTGSKNTYVGPTQINGGNLVITPATYIGQPNLKSGEDRVSLASDVYVNKVNNNDTKFSAFYAQHADLANVNNNGYTELYDVTLKNLANQEGAILGLHLPSANGVDENKAPVHVKGDLVLGNNSKAKVFFPGNWSSDTDQAEYVNRSGKTYKLIRIDGNIKGQFAEVFTDRPLYELTLIASNGNHEVNAKLTSTTVAKALPRVTTRSLGADSAVLTKGAENLDLLLAQAETDSQSQAEASSTKVAVKATTDRVTDNATEELTKVVTRLASLDEVAGQTLNVRSVSLAGTELSTTTTPTTPQTQAQQLAALIQELKAGELLTTVYAQAGTTYANLQTATSSQTTANLDNFKSTVNRFKLNDEQIHAYVSYQHGENSLSQLDSAIRGKLNTNSYTLGAYQQLATAYGNLNLGVAFTKGSSSWSETLRANSLTDKLISEDVNLGSAQVTDTGVILSAGLAQYNSTHGLSLGINRYAYDLELLSFGKNYKQAKFHSWATTLGYDLGYKKQVTNEFSVLANLGVYARYLTQSAFTEQLANGADKKAAPLNYSAKARGHWLTGASFGVNANYSMDLAGFTTNWYSGAKLFLQSAAKNHLELTNGGSTANGFADRAKLQLQAGVDFKLNADLMLQLKAQHTRASHHQETNYRLGVDFRF